MTRFLKSLRWKKKREFQRMTAEEKILYKLKLVNSVAIAFICFVAHIFDLSSFSCKKSYFYSNLT